ncbi:UNVERIFIED_CONTAM: hypothetical protein HDU68_004186, partial [Siphonaria sp. JEL0065]
MAKKIRTGVYGLILAAVLLLLSQTTLLENASMGSDSRQRIPSGSVDLDQYFEEYRRLFDREPPPNYDKWLLFAHKYACLMHPKEYRQIQTDFTPWIAMGGIPASKISTVGLHYWNVTRIGHFQNGAFTHGPPAIMDPISHLIPKEKAFAYVINKHDFPVSIPADDGYKG